MKDANETIALANKVVDLLAKGAEQVGQSASQAFPYVVRYEWAQALTWVSVGVVFLSISVAMVIGFCYSHKKDQAKESHKRSDGEVFVAWAALALVSLAISCGLIGQNLPTVIEPTGSTIMSILKHVAK